MKPSELLILGLGLLAASAVCAKDVYRWFDDSGTVHYADTPPEGIEAELVHMDSEATDRAQMARSSEATRARQQADSIRAAETTARKQEEKAGQEDLSTQRAELCTKARERYQVYINNRRLYRVLENGEREWYSDDEIEAARESARKSVEEFCD